MKKLFSNLLQTISQALTNGLNPMDAAISYWESCNGSRVGLMDALLLLADDGYIVGKIGGTSRRVIFDISSVTRLEIQKKAEVAADHIEIKEKRVFVVYGRDLLLRDSMFTFLRAINIQPIEFNELIWLYGSGTPYIGPIIDLAFEKAQAVVVMLTPDEDVALCDRLVKDESGKQPGQQARPNVIFEAGQALAKNPDHTIIVEIGKLRPFAETFSDILGRHTVRLDDNASDSVARRQDLAQRLKVAGCRISIQGTDWHTCGSFKTI